MLKRHIRTILWDIDGTLLSFDASERHALSKLLAARGITMTEEMLSCYHRTNDGYWKRLERGEVNKQELVRGRFTDFFTAMHLPVPDDIEAFNAAFQEALAEQVFPHEGAVESLRVLHPSYRQYIVSNGATQVQRRKISLLGIAPYIDGVFLSDEIGAQKPQRAFFDALRIGIPHYDEAETVIIGDSLTSDIKGGHDAGILTIWYAPHGEEPAPDVAQPDHILRTLVDLPVLLDRIA